MGNPAKAKGYRGEVEVMRIIETIVREEYGRRKMSPPELNRSPNGRDLRGIGWIAVEVKYRETMQMNQWWDQCKVNTPKGSESVLIWRANYQPWRVRMFGYLDAGDQRVRCPVDISLDAFCAWFRARLCCELDRALAENGQEKTA